MCRDCLQSSLKISLDWRSFSVDVNKEDPSIMIRNDISSHYQCLVPQIKTLNCLNVPFRHVCKRTQPVQKGEASSNYVI